MEHEKASRMSELAFEILGAQTGAKMIEEIWNAATPELKNKLADEILTRSSKDVSSFSVGRQLEALVVQRVEAALKDQLDALTATAVKMFEARKETEVAAAVSGLVNSATRKMVAALAEHLKTWHYRTGG